MAPVTQTPGLSKRFMASVPNNAMQEDLHALVRSKAHGLADLLDSMVPDGREKALCLTKIEEAVFWANAGIARGEQA